MQFPMTVITTVHFTTHPCIRASAPGTFRGGLKLTEKARPFRRGSSGRNGDRWIARFSNGREGLLCERTLDFSLSFLPIRLETALPSFWRSIHSDAGRGSNSSVYCSLGGNHADTARRDRTECTWKFQHASMNVARNEKTIYISTV